ncbi:MAG: hypothetical protein WAQ27_06455 [Candidatus Microsaccharimonas sp.]
MVEIHTSTQEQPFLEYTPPLDRPVDVLLDIAALNLPGEPKTFGATPLDQLATIEQQYELLNSLSILVQNAPSDVPAEVAEYVRETFRNRFVARGLANDENYNTALLSSSQYEDNPEVMELIERAKRGFASPAELLLVRQLLGIRSVELACVTHPYGRRMGILVDDMRPAVRAGILLMGGEYYEESDPRLRIKEVILANVPLEDMPAVYGLSNRERLKVAEQYGGVAGILLTRKRTVGKMPDGTVIRERSSFVLRGDSLTLNPGDLQALIEHESETWEDTAVTAVKLDQLVLRLLSMNQYSRAIPISSTIYASNDEVAARIRERELEKADLPQPEYSDSDRRAIAVGQIAMDGISGTKTVSMMGEMMFIGPRSLE